MQLRDAVMPFFEGRQPENLILHAKAGAGEEVMRILKGFERNSRARVVHVDCWRYSTRMAVYSLIARAIGEMLPRRGLARDEVFDRIIEVMEKDGARLLLVLDGLEELFHNGEEGLLRDVSGRGKLFGVVGIAYDARLRGRVGAEFGWREAVWIDGGMTLERTKEKESDSVAANLSDEERIIIDIVRTGPKSSTELYNAFFRKAKRSKRQIRNYVLRLETRRLLSVKTVAGVSPLLNTKRIELSPPIAQGL